MQGLDVRATNIMYGNEVRPHSGTVFRIGTSVGGAPVQVNSANEVMINRTSVANSGAGIGLSLGSNMEFVSARPVVFMQATGNQHSSLLSMAGTYDGGTGGTLAQPIECHAEYADHINYRTDGGLRWEKYVSALTSQSGRVFSAGRYTSMGISYDLSFYNRGIWPLEDGEYDIGTNAERYKDIYLDNAPTVTSDARDKNEVEDVDPEKSVAFLRSISPKLYKLLGGTRIHCGLIAQQVRESTSLLGDTSTVDTKSDFAFLCHAPATTQDDTDLPQGERKEHRDRWSVRYSELIGFLIAGWKASDAELRDLQLKMDELQSHVAKIDAALVNMMDDSGTSRKRKRIS